MEIEIFKPHRQPRIKNVELIETVELVCRETKIRPDSVHLIFLKDAELSEMHREFLDDASPTDVITFDLGEKAIEAELYISVDMARQNADYFSVPVNSEFHRLIIHGLLHLAGFDDHDPGDRKKMKTEEDRLVALRTKM